MMKRLATLMLVVCVVVLAGCNTMQGLGKDIENTGEAIQRKAK
jgi:predicted small secreted protein